MGIEERKSDSHAIRRGEAYGMTRSRAFESHAMKEDYHIFNKTYPIEVAEGVQAVRHTRSSDG